MEGGHVRIYNGSQVTVVPLGSFRSTEDVCSVASNSNSNSNMAWLAGLLTANQSACTQTRTHDDDNNNKTVK